jgi:hypothetical protein
LQKWISAMASPLFPKFNQTQQHRQRIQDSLKAIQQLSKRTEAAARVRLMNETRRLRQSLSGENRELDRQLTKLENDAQRNVISVHSGAKKAVEDMLKMFTAGSSQSTSRVRGLLGNILTGGLRDLSGIIEQSVNLIDQLAPQLFGTEGRTPEQAGGTQVEMVPPRRIVPAEPDTWNGMRLVDDHTVEIRTANFRGRYRTTDPEVTAEMVPVTSSNVHSIGFVMNLKNPANSELRIRFLQGKGTSKTAGPLYGYANFHPTLFRQFIRANSKGTFVWDEVRIRGTVAGSQYRYTLLETVGGNVPRRAMLVNGVQILKRRKKMSKSGRMGVSRLQTQILGPYRPTSNRVNRGNPDRGSSRPNRGR